MGFPSTSGDFTSRRHRVRPFLVTISVLILFLHFHIASTITITGKCAFLCNERRSKGQKESFKFHCKDLKEDKQEHCMESCESCPKEVCDETLDNMDDRFGWHCPSTHLEHRCKEFCSKNRPQGTREAYTFECEETMDTSNICTPECKRSGCPNFVCDKAQKNKYHCPYESFEGKCRMECDKIRAMKKDIKYMSPFQFECDQEYSSDPSSQQTCKDVCLMECPSWVCQGSSGKYHCPSAEVQNDCKRRCDEKRDAGDSSAYILDCEQSCGSDCNACASPDGINFACDTSNDDIILCPPKEPDNHPIPPGKPSYKGTCKDHCETNRGGGWESYLLDCRTRYDTIQEEQSCEQVCPSCPPGVCDSANPRNIQCRAVERELEKERKEKEEEEKRREKQIKDKEGEYSGDMNKTRLIYIMVLLLIFLIVAGFVLYTTIKNKKRRVHATTPLLNQQQPAVVATPLQSPMESVSGVSQPSAQLEGTANTQ